LEDRLLVDKVLQGDRQAFAMIIKSTERLVAHIVFKMISNGEARKDLAQDIYLKAYKNLPNFKFQSKLSTWIGQIAYNTCLNYLEKKKLIFLDRDLEGEETNGKTLQGMDHALIGNSENEIESRIFKSELTTILLSVMELLPPLYKTLITLYHYEELSYEEIAQITKLPIGTVKNYLFRARKLLKDHLLTKYKNEDL
jgi:RNA polymerase sigma-70 factor (ECF subfamily)